jgi:hypothetical protein
MKGKVLAEYNSPGALLAAIEALRGKGYRSLDAYTPYPVPGLEEALGARRSRLPWAVFAVGSAAAAGAYWLQWLLNAYLYPLNVGARPPHYPLSFVPITFEMGILLGCFTAFLGVLAGGRLLRPYDPVFEADGFESASKDRFWVSICASDPAYERERTQRDLQDTQPARVSLLEGTS